MSKLKVNEVQNFNGSSLTLTASTVSTSAQLNTGGNISVTGSLNVSDDSTTRTNLGLGTIAIQAADSVAITGGTITGGTITNSVIVPTSPFSFRNRFINGNQVIDQRNNGSAGTASVGTITYATDRWYIYSVGATCGYQRVAGPNTADFAIQITPASSNTNSIVAQRIENLNCLDLSGQSVTISGKAFIDNASGVTFNTNVYVASSANSSYGSLVSFSSTLTSGQYVNFSGTVTLGANAINGIEVDFSFLSAAGKTIKLTNLQLEIGTVATPFEHRPIGVELSLCQRYCQKSYDLGTAPGTDVSSTYLGLHFSNGISDGQTSQNVPFTIHVNPRMRSQPTFYYYSVEGTVNRYNTFTGGGMSRSETSSALSASYRGESKVSGYAGPGAGNSYGFCYLLTSEL